MDFITGLPHSHGADAILVVVDRFSNYGHFIALKLLYYAKRVAEKFVKEIVRLHGMHKTIVNDLDSIFLSNFWSELFRLHGTKLKMSTAYHPETDGQGPNGKFYIGGLKPIFDTSPRNNQNNGISGFVGQNFGTILLIIQLLV